MNKRVNDIEILAPAGTKEAFINAINNGANAVYLGGKTFSARAYASNFDNNDLIEIVDYAHIMGVKVYVTVNTLIKETEFDEAVEFVKFLYENNIDGVIMQDFGLIRYCSQVFPDLEIHASTQINCHSVKQALFLKSMGIKRIVVAREIDIKTIEEICKIKDIEVEVFVHGALCVCYSGNCYISSFAGNRSGNRGRCAQPCRKGYKLETTEDGVVDEGYLLSTKELMTIDFIQDFVNAGVKSFKIEGRMKRPEYVGVVVRSYYEALRKANNDVNKEKMAVMFNREFTKGFINNANNTEITNINTPNHIGIKIGKVVKVIKNYAYIKLSNVLHNNDSIRIVGSVEDAITINGIIVNEKLAKVGNIGDIIKVRTHVEVNINSDVLKTTDASLIEEINNVVSKKIKINGKLYLDNDYIMLEITDGINTVVSKTQEKSIPSDNKEFYKRIIDQVNKTSSTHYEFEKLECLIKDRFIQIKLLNEMRRNAFEMLDNLRKAKRKIRFADYKGFIHNEDNSKNIYIKVRDKAQRDQLINLGIGNILVEKKEYKNDNDNIILINPRISNENSLDLYDFSNYDISSVYLNCFNSYALNFLHERGAKIIGLSIELSKVEIDNAIMAYKLRYGVYPNVMMMVYGHIELMITKHCLINKALGLEKKNCKKCYVKQYYLNEGGNRLPLIDDGNCNLKVLSTKQLNLFSKLSELKQMNINNILLDFSIEKDIDEIVRGFYESFINDKNYKLTIEDSLGHYHEGVL